MLDPALLRPGRFDRRVIVDRPDIRGREEVLRVHSKKVPMAEDVNLNVLARGTPGFSGADLANMVNEAALTAARFNRKSVHMFDFEVAKDKVLMGAERKSMLLSDEEKKVTAYHEAGHVLVAAMRDHSDPLHKVTIIPRGMALGVTMHLPEEDKHTVTKDYLETQLAILMGGRCAEEIFLKQMTTGAGNDIERATALARAMVCEYGMSDLGPHDLRQEGAGGLPRPRDRPGTATSPTTPPSRSTRRFAASSTPATSRPTRSSTTNHDIMHRMASRPAGARDAGRRRDQADHRRQGAARRSSPRSPRVGPRPGRRAEGAQAGDRPQARLRRRPARSRLSKPHQTTKRGSPMRLPLVAPATSTT